MRFPLLSLLLLCSLTATWAQKSSNANNTLLWKISGGDAAQPSYLFGTMHMVCAEDLQLSPSLLSAIDSADRVYLEVDLDNIFAIVGMMGKLKMRDDTTLADLLSEKEYEKIKTHFSKNKSMLPFSMLERMKPMLTSSMLTSADVGCENTAAVDQWVLQEAKESGKKVYGLETLAYQVSIFDSIPYAWQAKQLLASIKGGGEEKGEESFEVMSAAYKRQDLAYLEKLTAGSPDMAPYLNALLYNRNRNWVEKLKGLLPNKSLVVAVGAGHLPGKDGVIQLLRAAGYKVEPVTNDMSKKRII